MASSMDMGSCAACYLMHKECNAECEMRQCFPKEAIDSFAILTSYFGDSENVVRMVKNITPDKRLAFIRSLEFEACSRSVDPTNGCLGLINRNLEITKLLKEQVKNLQNMRDILATQFQNKHNINKGETCSL